MRATVALLLLATLLCGAAADTVVLLPTDDATISEAQPDDANGQGNLVVGRTLQVGVGVGEGLG